MENMAVHQPGTDVIVGNPDSPRPPSSCYLIPTLLSITVKHRRVTPSRRVMFKVLLVCDRIIRSIAGSQVPIMLPVRVHRMIFEETRGTRVAEPYYIQYLSNLGRECLHDGIPALMLHGNIVVRRFPVHVCVNEVWLVVQARCFCIGPR